MCNVDMQRVRSGFECSGTKMRFRASFLALGGCSAGFGYFSGSCRWWGVSVCSAFSSCIGIRNRIG